MSKSNAVGTKLNVDGVKVGGLNNLNGIDISAETLDVTDFDNSTGYRDFLAGFKEVGELTGSGFLDGDDAGQEKCYELLNSGDVVACSIVFPTKIGKTWSFQASVIGFHTEADIGDAITFEVTLAVTGQPILADTAVSAG